MKFTKRLWIGWHWSFRQWDFGKMHACCGCFIFELGPLSIEYLGDECFNAQESENESK